MLRSIKFGLQGIFRNPLSSVSLLITFLSVNLVMVVAALGVNVFNSIYQNAASKFTLVIPLKITTPQNELSLVAEEILRFSEVETTGVISGADEAENLLDREGILTSSDITDPSAIDDILNSFPDQIEVSLAQDANIRLFLDSLRNSDVLADYIDISATERLYAQTEEEIDTLVALRDSVAVSLLLFVVVLGFQCFSAVYNTIQISIGSRRDEVEIMHLVGANISYIRTPFLIESVLIFIIGFMVSSAGVYFLIDKFNVNLNDIFYLENLGSVDVMNILIENAYILFLLPAVFLLTVTLTASYSSIKKYIKI
jgi:cell division transport system permease protein